MKGESGNTHFDAVQTWLDSVAYSHSNSKRTDEYYRHSFTQFLKFIDKSAKDILEEYEGSTDRAFKRKYAQLIKAWIGSLMRQDYTNLTIKCRVGVICSFFKYNDLPLGHVPVGKGFIVYHNRDITREEIAHVLTISTPRDRAFFSLMAQSGLRPYTICKLKLKHIEPDFTSRRIPCKIDVPQEIAKGKYRSYFTFVGEEAVKHLHDYLKTRPRLTGESYLFSQYGKEKPLDRRNVSHVFHKAIVKLKQKGEIDFKQKQRGKPSNVRLYNLRKWFRKQAHQAGFEYVQFWMGHIVKEGQEEHYRPKDVEHHRQLYAEKSMPFLRLETPTPTETDKLIAKQAEEIEALKSRYETRIRGLEKDNKELRKDMAEISSILEKIREKVSEL